MMAETRVTQGVVGARVLVVVDGYTSGRFIAEQVSQRFSSDVVLVHVRSTKNWLPSMPAPDMRLYALSLDGSDYADCLERLLHMTVVGVVAGQEPGVELADRLAADLQVPGNDPALSSARRDKFVMWAQLESANVPVGQYHIASSVAEVGRRAGTLIGAGGKVVVKPRRSAASDHVYVVDDVDKARQAAAAVLQTATIYRECNTDVLVQEYLEGIEYVVDHVSLGSERYLCGVWQYTKKLTSEGRPIYDLEHLVSPSSRVAVVLDRYVREALTALGVTQGPSHAEVIMTKSGPRLIEVGTRITGNMRPDVHDLACGGNQAYLASLAALDERAFLAWIRQYGQYRQLMHAACHTGSTTASGVVQRVDADVLKEMHALPSVVHVDVKMSPGMQVRPTDDLYSSITRVFLASRSAGRVRADLARIKTLEAALLVVE